ncbi:MAG: sigma-70 family RNA polymerase sigma factor [Planctomycetota bacterium]
MALASLRPSVVDFLRHRCRDEHQAEDLAQDTLLRAARFRSMLGKIERPRAWALQIAANLHRDQARRESWQRLLPPDHPTFGAIPGTEPVPGDDGGAERFEVEGRLLDLEDVVREVRATWAELMPRDRVVLDAYYLDGSTTEETARACRVAPRLVKVRLFRARRRLESAVRRRLTGA